MFLANADGVDKSKELREYWNPLINVRDEQDNVVIPDIEDTYRRDVTTRLLENYKKVATDNKTWDESLTEAPTNVTGAQINNWDPVLISLIRRAAPNLIAFDVMGVQPMNGPTGLIFSIKSHYDSQTGVEAMFDEPVSMFSATGDAQVASRVNGTLVIQVTGTYTDGLVITGGTSGAQWEIEDAGTLTAGLRAITCIVDATPPRKVFQIGEAVTDSSTGTGTVVSFHTEAMPTADSEALGDGSAPHFNEMAFSITKTSVTAKTRALKAEYSTELAQDLRAIHGLDAETELSNMLSTEITAEINREMINTLYFVAKVGAQKDVTVPGTFNLNVDSNGRWSVERFKGLMIQLERDANAIARETRRGRGNVIICSSDVATALSMAGKLDTTPALAGNNLTVDDTGNTFVGVLNGRYRVYIDPYWASTTTEFYMVGYRGPSFADQGAFYAPYVPLEMVRAVGENTFQPKIAFKTRYGVVSNPFVEATGALVNGTNPYYRRVTVTNLM